MVVSNMATVMKGFITPGEEEELRKKMFVIADSLNGFIKSVNKVSEESSVYQDSDKLDDWNNTLGALANYVSTAGKVFNNAIIAALKKLLADASEGKKGVPYTKEKIPTVINQIEDIEFDKYKDIEMSMEGLPYTDESANEQDENLKKLVTGFWDTFSGFKGYMEQVNETDEAFKISVPASFKALYNQINSLGDLYKESTNVTAEQIEASTSAIREMASVAEETVNTEGKNALNTITEEHKSRLDANRPGR